MKRFFCLFIALLLMLSSFGGCTRREAGDRIDIVCTIFPIYDWIVNMIGEDAPGISVRLLVKQGTDPHSYMPTPTDIAAIHAADILVYVGGESDFWISDVLDTTKNENIKTIGLLDKLGDRAAREETVEGMQCEDEHCHDHDHDHGHSDESDENVAFDEHVWLSVKNAAFLCESLMSELSDMLPKHSEKIEEQGAEYISKLTSLDEKFSDAVKSAEHGLLIFADRFPFRYLVDDYGLEYFAAFAGCEADSEASFETVVFLSQKLKESELDTLIILESSTDALAQTVISNSGCDGVSIVVMDSMQSITQKQIESGVSYISVMEKNLAAITVALN